MVLHHWSFLLLLNELYEISDEYFNWSNVVWFLFTFLRHHLMFLCDEMNNKTCTSLFNSCVSFDLQNKSFIRAVSCYFCTESTHCLLKSICSTQSSTGVAKHIAGVKEVQGGVSWVKLDLPFVCPSLPSATSWFSPWRLSQGVVTKVYY